MMVMIWAAILLACALALLVLWQKLQDATQQLAKLRAHAAENNAELHKEKDRRSLLEAALASEKKSSEKLHKDSAYLRDKLYKTTQEMQQSQQGGLNKLAEFEEKISHLRSQEQALTAQLQGIDSANREFRLKCEEKSRELEKTLIEERKRFQQELSLLKHEAKDELRRAHAGQRRAEQELLQIKTQRKQESTTQEGALKDQQQLQGRLQQAEKLYQMMRSHKELTAERNEYLVKVCQILAAEVIAMKDPTPAEQGDIAFGALVSKAINLVRAREPSHELQA
jgi:hypothetical protein